LRGSTKVGKSNIIHRLKYNEFLGNIGLTLSADECAI